MGIINKLKDAGSAEEVRHLIKEALTYEFASPKTMRKAIKISKKRIKEFK